MKKALIVSAFLLMAAMLFAAGADDQAEEAFKVGFVFTGPIADGGWTQQHNAGRLAVEDMGIETLYKESVPNNQESAKVMRDMIDQGAKMIFATSFGYMDYMLEVAAEFPEVKFFHCGGYKQSDNAVNYLGKIYQARYLSGIVAGMKTETDKIGYIAAFEIPEVVRGINAFTLGVRSVNPSATVEVLWTHNWNDPPNEKEASFALIDNGCDVIAQHQTGPANLQAAEARGVWGVGYHADMNAAAPEACLTSPYWNWGPYYTQEVKRVMDGSWDAVNYWGGMDEDVVRLADLGKNASPGAADAVATAKDAIVSGDLKVFAGPLKNNDGEMVYEAGYVPNDGELLGMNFLVDGVIGTIDN